MRPFRTWRLRFKLLLLVGLVALPGTALAYWTGTATTTTTIRLAQPLPVTIGPGTPSDQLTPGDSADVALVVYNPNTVPVHIAGLVPDDGDSSPWVTADADHSGCDVSALSFTNQTNSGQGWNIPPKVGATAGTLTIDLPDALAMTETAANACQGAQFTVLLDATS